MIGDRDLAELLAQLHSGSRPALARAVTLVESRRADHRQAARRLLGQLLDETGESYRIGISGVPGVGKSTLIETLGARLIADGHRVGVLTVDPSSPRTGGSVLGDKTRMPALAAHPDAYVRPSPTSGTLGGVARATAQTIPLLEAAGYDVIIVETVGVGQSEVTVAGMVDTFALLALAGSGDQLQGIKKGVLELADVITVNKADGENLSAARHAAHELRIALHLVGNSGLWHPPVLTCSALTGDGVDEFWRQLQRHREALIHQGFREHRAAQRWQLTQQLVRDELLDRLSSSAAVTALSDELRAEVLHGRLPAVAAADLLLAALDRDQRDLADQGVDDSQWTDAEPGV